MFIIPDLIVYFAAFLGLFTLFFGSICFLLVLISK